MPQGTHFPARDGQYAAIEELDIRSWLARDLLNDFHRVGTLNLVSVAVADDGARSGHGALVPFEPDVVAAGCRMVLNPIVNRGTTDEIEQVLLHVNENDVADHVSVVVTRDELLAL